jgi:iron complex outermembrane recepter protein
LPLLKANEKIIFSLMKSTTFVMKKLFALTIITLTFATLNFAQTGKINGRIVASDEKPMEFVTVTLHQVKDTSLVKGAITDATGSYAFDGLKNGPYIVVAQQVGLKKAFSIPLSISDNSLTVNDLKLVEDNQNLKTVTITAQKPFIEHQIDKTVVNVENSSVAAGSTAMEVLEKSPGVSVDNDGKITLRGKDNVRIMVDGKPSQLSQEQLANLLKNMNANLIQKIEIITNPSAKYDAAGNAGIINIVMKKNQLYGLNGQVSSTYGQGVYHKSFNSLNLNYRYGKWNLFGSYNYNNRMNFNQNDITRLFHANNGKGALTDSFVSSARQYNPFISNSWRAGVDYNLSKNTTIGVLANGSFGHRNNGLSNTDHTNLTRIFAPDGTLKSTTLTTTKPDENWLEFAGNFNLKHTFDSLGREITVDADYFSFKNDEDQAMTISSLGETSLLQENIIKSKFDIKSLKFDYTHPLSKTTKLELGGKSSFVESDNDIHFYNTLNGKRVLDMNITNDFVYTENINAAYGIWSQELKKGISYQVGLRAENTNITGRQVTTDTSFARHYTDIFPTAFVMKKWGKNDKHAVRVSYSRRIDRPDYENLNPFRKFLDKYIYEQGNPNLTPQYSNNYDVNYTFMGAMSLGVNYSKTNDAITFVLKQNDATKQSYVTNENLATKTNYGVSLNVPIPITKKWMLSTNANFFINRYEGIYLGENLDLKIPVLNLNIQNRITLPKDWSAEVSGFYVSKAVQGLFIGNALWALNAGISKQMLNNRLSLRLNAQDIFWSQKFTGQLKHQNLDLKVQGYNDSRQVRFTATYRFGNQKVQQARRRSGGATDEQNRIQKNG